MTRKLLAIAMLVVFGLARMPFEVQLDVAQRDAFFRGTKFDLSLRESIGQMGFIAALGGFRSLIAAILWIDGHAAWERTEWGRMAGIFNAVTTLQPRSLLYWDLSAWHMAYNASIAALEDKKQPSEALRIRAQRQYFDLGRDFLERGIRNNPDRPQLHEQLGVLLRDKYEDHCGAAKAFAKAATYPDARPYLARFAFYELAQCPGHEREAYEGLKKLYLDGEKQRLPSLINLLGKMEEKLNIPPSERLVPAPKTQSQP